MQLWAGYYRNSSRSSLLLLSRESTANILSSNSTGRRRERRGKNLRLFTSYSINTTIRSTRRVSAIVVSLSLCVCETLIGPWWNQETGRGPALRFSTHVKRRRREEFLFFSVAALRCLEYAPAALYLCLYNSTRSGVFFWLVLFLEDKLRPQNRKTLVNQLATNYTHHTQNKSSIPKKKVYLYFFFKSSA